MGTFRKVPPKVCRAIDEIVCELKKCVESTELPREGGNRSIRACSTHFIAHKVAALERITARLGAYLSHLCTLVDDPSVKSTDRQKLKGYLINWRDAKMILGYAYFHDLLKPASILCKSLQADEICVVSAIEGILKTAKNFEEVKSTSFENLPTVKVVLSRIQHELR